MVGGMSDISFEDSEFQQVNLDSALPSSKTRDFHSYFRNKYIEYVQQGDTRLAHLHDLLLTTVMLIFHPDQKEAFGTPEQLNALRLFDNGQLSDADAELLRGVLRNIDNVGLQARIGDVLWQFKKDYKSAKVALAAYLEYAKLNDDPEEWIEPVHALTRALSLSKSLGKNTPETEGILKYIEQCVIREDGQDSLLYSNRLIHLLIDSDFGDTKQLAELSEKLARSQEKSGDWYRIEAHWQLAAKCYRKQGVEDAERQAIISSAELWVKAADINLESPNLSRFQITYQLERAIQILRTIPNTQERVEEIRKKLLSIQEEAAKQMAPISISLEGKPEAIEFRQKAIEAVQAEDFLSAFIKFAQLQPPLQHEYLRKQAKDYEERYVLKRLFPTKIVDAFGRTVANPPQGPEETLLADVFQQQNLHRQSRVGLAIEPARQEILNSHTFTLQDLAPLINGNPLIHPNRGYSVLKGIVAGLQGDFLSASYILVPQIEATLRYVLTNLGRITSKYSSQGVQDEVSLNRMLEEDEFASTILDVFGQDTLYELRGLLVDRFGANFRNNLAHGLLFDGHFFDAQSI